MAKNRKKLQHLLSFLQSLKIVKPTHRKIIIAHLDNNSLECICEAITNILHNPNLPSHQLNKLKKHLIPYKNSLRYLSKKNRKHKKKKLIEIGGNPLTYILSAAIPLLINALT